MDSKVRKGLKGILTSDVTNYENYSLDEERKPKGLKIISDEVKILHDDETHRVDISIKRKKIKLEEIKANAQVALDNEKFNLEREKAKDARLLNDQKIEIERNKLNHQIKNESAKFNLEERKVDAGITVDEARLSLEKLKFELSKEVEERKLQFENKKLDHQQYIDEQKLSLDKEKNNIEERKLELEIEKFKEDILAKEGEVTGKRVDRIIGVGMELLKIGVPLVVYTRLVMKNFRLVYADDGRIPSEMRDLMKNIYKGKM